MPDNLNIESAVYRDFKAYFETPGEGLTAIANIKNLYEHVTNEDLIGCFIGVAYSENSIVNQSSQVSISGYYKTTVNITVKTYAPDDKDSALLRAAALAVRELMNREELATTLTNISVDQTYFNIVAGPSQPGNEKKLRNHDFSYTVIHKVNKE